MKKTLSKRLLSLFLAVLMVTTSVPFVSLTASAAEWPKSTSGAYLFAYFKNIKGDREGESIHFALSKDGYNFEALNTQNPVVYATSNGKTDGESKGTGHSRDPYIMKAQDGTYYMMATDLNSSSGLSNTSIHIWHSDNLIDWTYHQNITLNTDTNNANYIAWAPEAIWDPVAQSYMLYWAHASGNSDCNQYADIYYAYTDDFHNLKTVPAVLYSLDNGHGIIDADITPYEDGYVMLFKDESADKDGSKLVYATKKTGKSPSPSDGAYSQNYALINTANKVTLEGPQAYKLTGSNSWIVLADEYEGSKGFQAFVTSDFNSYSVLESSEYTLNHLSPNHGSVVAISDEEYTALTNAYGREVASQTNIPAGESPLDHLVAQYFVKQNPAEDNSGRENHIGDYNGDGITEDAGAVNNLNMVVKDGKLCAQFVSNDAESSQDSRDKGSYAWVETAKMLQNANAKTGVTISFEGYFDSKTRKDTHVFDIHDGSDFSDNFAWGNGSLDNHNLFLFETDGELYAYNDGERTANGDANFGKIATNEWHTYTMSITNKYILLLQDGQFVSKQVVSRADADWFNGIFKNGGPSTSKLSIGISSWVSNIASRNYLLDGYISNFCIFDRALSEADVMQAMDELNEAPQEAYDENTHKIYEDLCDKAGYDFAVTDDIYGEVLPLSNTNIASTANPVNDLADAAKNGYTYSMMYNPGDSITSGTIFRMGGESDGYLKINEDGTIAFKNGTSSFTTPELFTLKTDTWQHVTIQFVPYASYDRIYVYIDGKQVTMFDCYKTIEGNVTSTYPNNGGTAIDLIHATAAAPANVYYGDGVTGSVTDVQIYRGCVDAHDLLVNANAAYADKIIGEAMKNFELKMRDFNVGNILTNIADAYKLYDEASRYLDAVHYGGTEVDFEYLVQLNQDLLNAIEQMVPYEGDNFNTVTATVGGKAVDKQASNNILYAGDVNKNGASGKPVQFGAHTYEIYYGDVLFMYDGTQTDTTNIMSMPVVLSQYRNNGLSSMRLLGLYPCTSSSDPTDNSIFRLVSDNYNVDTNQLSTDVTNGWHGYTEDNDWTFSLTGGDRIGADRANTYKHYGDYFTTNSKNHFWFNVLQFRPDAAKELNGKVEGIYTLPWGFYGEDTKSHRTYDTAKYKGIVDKTNSSIYVLDVSGMSPEELFSVAKLFYTHMQNLTSYSTESALAMAEAVDQVTSFKPTDYDFSQGLSAAYKNLVADRDEIKKNFTDAVDHLELVDMADHAQLKADVDPDNPSQYAEAIEDLENGNKYTTSSSKELIDKYQDAVDYFNSLDPSDTNKNQPYADVNANTPDKLHEALDDAYKKLHEKADYTELNQVYAEKGHETLTTGDVQNATISSWIPYEEAATNAMKLSDDKDTNNAATYTVAQKDDQPKYATDPDTGYQMTDTNSAIQNTINAAADALNQAELKPVDSDEAYEVYCTAQATAQTADPSAYVDSAAIRTVQNYGLPDKAPEYTDGIQAVYVEYNGQIYKNTTTGETSEKTDNYTNRVLTAINGDKKTYDVTFNVLLDGKPVDGTVLMNGKAVANGTTEQHTYGDLVELSYATPEGARLVSWVVAKEGISTAINNTEETFTTKIQKDTVITLNFVSDTKEAVAIEMQDYFDRATLYNDIPVGTTATVSGDSIVLSTGETLKAQACAYFTFTHWTVTQAGVTTKAKDGDAIVINADTVFHAEGTRSADTMNYTFVGGTFADTKADKAAYPVDYRATAVADAVADGVTYYGIAMQTRNGYTMLTYKDSYDFYAYPVSKEFESLGGVNLVAITSDNIAAYFSGDDNQTTVTAKAPMSFGVGVYNASDNKFMMFCNLTDGLDENEYKVVERGIVYTNKQLSEDAFVKGAAGVVTNVSSTDLRDIQYMFTKTGVKETANRYARSYVSYEHYVHMNGMDVVIPMTSYGPIIALENGEIQ